MAESRFYEPCPNCGAQAEVSVADESMEIIGICLVCLDASASFDGFFRPQRFDTNGQGLIWLKPGWWYNTTTSSSSTAESTFWTVAL
jgi:hypothetical protein